MTQGLASYLMGILPNMVQILPICSITMSCIQSLTTNENKGLEYANRYSTIFETLGTLCLYLYFCYYLRLIDQTNHLTKMITKVTQKMSVFFLIFFITHLAFAETFFYVSSSSGSEFQIFNNNGFFDAFRYSFFISLGTYDLSKYNFEGVTNA